MKRLSLDKPSLVLISLALAACGGGGGGSSDPSSPSSGTPPSSSSPSSSSPSSSSPSSSSPTTVAPSQPTPPPQVFALQGGGSLTINSDGSAVFQQSEANTNLSPTLRGTPAFHTGFPGGTFLYQQNGTDVPIFVLERMGATVGLSVSDFGAWTSRSPDGPLGVLGRFYAGGHDPTVPLPSGAVFTYNGSYIGVMSGGNISGGIHLQADFGNLSISSQFTSGALSGWPNGGVGTGKINGDGSYGTSFATNNFGGAPGPVPSYKLSGQFYGQNAAETTGTFSGLAGSSGAAFNGAFGAKR